MQYPDTERELAALAAQRAKQRTLDAHHRALRLADARRREDDLIAQTDYLLAGIATLLRKLTGAERPAEVPVPLRQGSHAASGRRDAA